MYVQFNTDRSLMTMIVMRLKEISCGNSVMYEVNRSEWERMMGITTMEEEKEFIDAYDDDCHLMWYSGW